MNARVLELIKNPKIINETDLNILESEFEKMPYAQSIRALYLYGTNLYRPDNYKENLSKTAAYTTDKKILFQFVNSEKSSKKEEVISTTKPIGLVSENKEINQNIIEETKSEEPELINEIENTEILILPESDAEKITETKEESISDISESEMSFDVSFNGIEDFLPEVKFSVPKDHSDFLNPPRAEKETEKDKPQISFKNIQPFEIPATEIRRTGAEEDISKPEITETQASEWKPMLLSNNIPDALIGKLPEQNPVETTIIEEKIIEKEKAAEIAESRPEASESERPVFNVSFFGNGVSKIEEKKEIPATPEKNSPKESNVGTFINTWQSWLKIDRSETKTEPSKAKEKIIEEFIEKNPKISQLKENNNFVVKEKKEDISHLMTETLAKLYTEQKLYSKAIKAYEILSEKHPHKKDYFEKKIEKIGNLRKPQ